MAMRALLGMLFALAAGGAAAMDVPVAAKRLVVKDSARPRLVLTVKGPIPIPAPTPGGGDDPQVTGAVLDQEERRATLPERHCRPHLPFGVVAASSCVSPSDSVKRS